MRRFAPPNFALRPPSSVGSLLGSLLLNSEQLAIMTGSPQRIACILQQFRSLSRAACIAICCMAICGMAVCQTGCDVPIDSFEPNQLFTKRLELSERVSLEKARADVDWVLDELFGSPDAPQWPSALSENPQFGELISRDRLQRAAGAVRSDEQGTHFGLYREHCVTCHGVSGNGLGPTSRLLNPYPRDFRMGKFKFKSTPVGSRPTRADLLRTLRDGIKGTSMPSFRLIEDEDLQALVDYVIYLSVRGEVERGLLAQATYDLDLEAGQRVIDLSVREADAAEFQKQWQPIENLVGKIASSWAAADAASHFDVRPPSGFPLVGQTTDAQSQHLLNDSITHGRELFQGKVANCASCHGMEAAGDGVVSDFDDWTKDWTIQAGLDPKDKQQLKPMLSLGALKPRNILPRNLRSGIARGGSRPEDLYLRIVCGIEGTPMPAAPMQPELTYGLSETDVWDLVNFLLSLRNNATGALNK